MIYRTKIFLLGLSFLTFSWYPAYAAESRHFKENQDPQTLKRHRPISEFNDSQHKLKKQKISEDTQRLPYRSKDRDKQFQRLNTQSKFVEGSNCAKLRWVEDLTIFSEGESSLDYIEVPADIHRELAYVGNHLRAFTEQYSGTQGFKRNILIPHVSFVVKRPVEGNKEFIKGGYLNFDEDIPLINENPGRFD